MEVISLQHKAIYVAMANVNNANSTVNVHLTAGKWVGMNAKHNPEANGNTLSNINILLSDSSLRIDTVATVIIDAFSSNDDVFPRKDSDGHWYLNVKRQL